MVQCKLLIYYSVEMALSTVPDIPRRIMTTKIVSGVSQHPSGKEFSSTLQRLIWRHVHRVPVIVWKFMTDTTNTILVCQEVVVAIFLNWSILQADISS